MILALQPPSNMFCYFNPLFLSCLFHLISIVFHQTAIMHFRLPYDSYVGGAIALTEENMEKINGFSNVFFGWGGEDDDIGMR